MLVLSRKVGQSLVIAEGVVVTVSEIGSDYVRLSVEAPDENEVRRRYPQALKADDADTSERPIVATISLHHAAVLDRVRRQMVDDEGTLPTRDEALGVLLDAVAENEDLIPLGSARRSRTHAAKRPSRVT